MTYQFFIGWDVSKSKLDYSVFHGLEHLKNGVIPNTVEAISKLLDQLEAELSIPADQTLHCAENTGRYTNRLRQASIVNGLQLWVEDPANIKKGSAGRDKDKTDALDAGRIAEYAFRYQDRVKLYQATDGLTSQLRTLNTQRRQLVKALTGMRVAFKEDQLFASTTLEEQDVEEITKGHDLIKAQIQAIENIMRRLIDQNPLAKRVYQVAKSVPGMGPKNTIVVMVITGLFERIDNARSCASYAGIAPHKHQSGSSVNRKSRTSKAANSELKTAFHQGAIALITRKGIYRDKYEKLITKGKTHLQAVNAIRNKIIGVLFACVKKDSMYDKNYHLSLHSL
jgi:transposase